MRAVSFLLSEKFTNKWHLWYWVRVGDICMNMHASMLGFQLYNTFMIYIYMCTQINKYRNKCNVYVCMGKYTCTCVHTIYTEKISHHICLHPLAICSLLDVSKLIINRMILYMICNALLFIQYCIYIIIHVSIFLKTYFLAP